MKILLVADKESTKKNLKNIITSNDSLEIITDSKNIANRINDFDADILIADMQVSQMGGIAIAIDIEMEQEMDRCKKIPILVLLDRTADQFLANRASCDFILKPFSIFEIREKIEKLCKVE